MSIFTVLRTDIKTLYKILLATSVVSLIGAYYVEYFMNLPPCVLCLYQRYCYFAIIIFSIVGLYSKENNKQIYFLVILTIVNACTIAGYHAGVERGIFAASSVCASQIELPDNADISDIKNLLYNKPVASCSRSALNVLGLSMSEWNLLLNLGLLFIMLQTYFVRDKNHAKT